MHSITFLPSPNPVSGIFAKWLSEINPNYSNLSPCQVTFWDGSLGREPLFCVPSLTSLSRLRISREKRLHCSSISSTLISFQEVVLHAAILDSTKSIMSHSSFSRPTSRLNSKGDFWWNKKWICCIYTNRKCEMYPDVRSETFQITDPECKTASTIRAY